MHSVWTLGGLFINLSNNFTFLSFYNEILHDLSKKWKNERFITIFTKIFFLTHTVRIGTRDINCNIDS